MPKTEGALTSELLRVLRKALPAATVWKLSDRWTAGIPDIVVIHGVNSTWFECKVAPSIPTPLQLAALKRIKEGYVITWHRDRILLGRPWSALWQNEVYPNTKMLLKRIIEICTKERT